MTTILRTPVVVVEIETHTDVTIDEMTDGVAMTETLVATATDREILVGILEEIATELHEKTELHERSVLHEKTGTKVLKVLGKLDFEYLWRACVDDRKRSTYIREE